MTSPQREQVYAILRFDSYFGPDTPPETAVTVKEIVRDRDIAEAEVDRLNRLNREKGCWYWWQQTRLFEVGESFRTHR